MRPYPYCMITKGDTGFHLLWVTISVLKGTFYLQLFKGVLTDG